MTHATYFKTEWGMQQIRASVAEQLPLLSDRDVFARTFAVNPEVPDPEYMAELTFRGLGDCSTPQNVIAFRIEQREKLAAIPIKIKEEGARNTRSRLNQP